MVLVDDEGVVAWMSEGLASMCGDPERFRGRCWVEMVLAQGEGKRLAATLSRVGYLANEPVSLRGPGGESIPVKLSAARLGDAEASWATVTITRPPSHPQLSDQRFPRSLDCMKAILDTSPDGVVVIGGDREISYVNPAAEQMLDRSQAEIVGKPVALLLLHRHATVTLCHSRTRDLAGLCREADILVAAVGRARLVQRDWVKPGAAVIDVGVSSVDGELVGDVDTEGVQGRAKIVTPHRRGVGPMTITMLLVNTLAAYEDALG